jgi:hypothetical protein
MTNSLSIYRGTIQGKWRRELDKEGSRNFKTIELARMRKLTKSFSKHLVVLPKYPYREVFISEDAYRCLLQAQLRLAPYSVELILKRGYEYENTLMKCMHKAIRVLGAILFGLVYPHRISECKEIFSPNGHDRSGDCIDVSILHNGHIVELLPYGVFATKKQIKTTLKTYGSLLNLVWTELERAGFSIHKNETESLQIHCELMRGSTIKKVRQ